MIVGTVQCRLDEANADNGMQRIKKRSYGNLPFICGPLLLTRQSSAAASESALGRGVKGFNHKKLSSTPARCRLQRLVRRCGFGFVGQGVLLVSVCDVWRHTRAARSGCSDNCLCSNERRIRAERAAQPCANRASLWGGARNATPMRSNGPSHCGQSRGRRCCFDVEE